MAQSITNGFHLIYLPGFPGRGEHIRLVLEAAGVGYTDTAHLEASDCLAEVSRALSDQERDNTANSVPFAPPILKNRALVIWQKPNILLYLGELLNLSPSENDPAAKFHVNALALTALDGLSNKAHDVHHPIAKMQYYEQQRDAALRRSVDYRTNRLPKYLLYFERILYREQIEGGVYLYGGQLSYADLVLFQTLDGLHFAFPKCIHRLKTSGDYGRVFSLYELVKNLPNLRKYFDIGRRQKYGKGLYRNYAELNDLDE